MIDDKSEDISAKLIQRNELFNRRDELEPSLCSQDTVDEDDQRKNFECLYCLSLVKNPQQCGNCSRVYCHGCLQMWFEKGSTKCPDPYCQQELYTCDTSPCDQTVVSLLQLRHTCKVGCLNATYGEFATHECGQFIKCLASSCQETLPLHQMQDHWMKCQFVRFQCNKCAVKLTNYKMHKCD